MAMKSDVTKAMILAAGRGTRLGNLTHAVPKPLLPIDGIPLIVRQMRWLKHHGVAEVAINLYHLGEKIQEEIGDGSRFGIKVTYSPEESLLGTAGGVKRIQNFFDRTAFIVYGDVLCDIDLTALSEFHKAKKAILTVALYSHPRPWEAGVVEVDQDKRLIGFKEKPGRGEGKGSLVNAGIYMIEPDIMKYIPETGYYDFGFDLFPKLLSENLPVFGYTIDKDEYLIDIGTPENFQRANEDIKAKRMKIYSE